MRYRTRLIVCLAVGSLVAIPSFADERTPDTTQGAQIFEDLGSYHREFTTQSDEAQQLEQARGEEPGQPNQERQELFKDVGHA